jgi:hypothetical protein
MRPRLVALRLVPAAVAALAALGASSACELLAGIKDKTLADDGTDPAVPCAQQPPNLFCDDFDEDLEAGSKWQWDTPLGGSTIALTTAQAQTPPRSVQVVAPVQKDLEAQLGAPAGSLQSGFRLAFDLYVDEADLSSLAQVGVAQINLGAAGLSVNYVLGPGPAASLQVFENASQATVVEQSLPQPPPLRTWTRIVLVYDAAQGVTVLEDGATLATGPAAAKGPPGQTQIILGAVYVNPPGSTPYQVDIDTVVMRGE